MRPKALFTSIWLGMVTTTTLSYGDVTPKSIVGKILTMCWMVTGILLSAIVTGTMTNVFSGVDYLDIYRKQVVAKQGSVEAMVAKHHYLAEVSPVSNYGLLFQALSEKEIEIGLVNSIVHMYHKKNGSPLKTIKGLGEEIDISWIHANYNQDDYIYINYTIRLLSIKIKAQLHNEQ